MIRRTALPTLLIATALAAVGCIQRTITVNSEPEGALVWLNDEEVGRTPVTVPFTFYGTYSVRLEKEGYKTLNTDTEAEMPWWELPGPDLVAEALPGTRRVDLQWEYKLPPEQPAVPRKLLERARDLRSTFEQPEGSNDATPTDPDQPSGEGSDAENAEAAGEKTDAGNTEGDGNAEDESSADPSAE